MAVENEALGYTYVRVEAEHVANALYSYMVTPLGEARESVWLIHVKNRDLAMNYSTLRAASESSFSTILPATFESLMG